MEFDTKLQYYSANSKNVGYRDGIARTQDREDLVCIYYVYYSCFMNIS